MKFIDIQTDKTIKQKLIQTIQDQRVSHAQLFYGPEGSGKLALAIAYAQMINCTAPKSPDLPPGPLKGEVSPQGGSKSPLGDLGVDSCGICPSCIQFQKLAHPDLHFFYPTATTKQVSSKPSSKHFIEEWRKFLLENNYRVNLAGWYDFIGIENKQGTIYADDANEINRILSYKSYESEYKVVIIWMIEKLFHAAAPKLLKILEEPPEKTLFILVSDNPDQVIPTLVSRCLPVRIPKIQPEETRLTSKEDQVLFETFRKWMRICFANNIPELIGFASDVGKIGREKQKSLLQYGLDLSGNALALRHGFFRGSASGGEESEFIKKFSPFLSETKLLPFYTLLNSSIYHIERNAHAPTLFLDLSLKFTGLLKR
ncbi:MAG: hypothetical protein V1733_03775 [bacterium]